MAVKYICDRCMKEIQLLPGTQMPKCTSLIREVPNGSERQLCAACWEMWTGQVQAFFQKQ